MMSLGNTNITDQFLPGDITLSGEFRFVICQPVIFSDETTPIFVAACSCRACEGPLGEAAAGF